MNFPNVSQIQHARILGFATIGYGVASLIETTGPIQAFQLLGRQQELQGWIYWPKILFGIGLFIVCLAAGIVIKDREHDPKILGLSVAIVTFGFFPLGTILSVYLLLFIFVINQVIEPQTEPQINE
jgi:hypothetical protein